MLDRVLAARGFWDAYKNWVWIVVPIATLVLALPALKLIPSYIEWCRLGQHGVPVSEAAFRHCVALTRATEYVTRLIIAGPLAGMAYVIVFFSARAEAAGRGLALTFGGLADVYFIYLAFISPLSTFFIGLLFIGVVDAQWSS